MNDDQSKHARHEYERLLILLHKEIREGRCDDAQAELYRDEMDIHWKNLTAQDLNLLDALSGDLYMLGGEEMKSPLEEGESEAVLDAQACQAFQQKQWLQVLTLHRKIRETPPHLVAYVRARCWMELGFVRAAVCFLEWACEQLTDHKISYATI